MSHRYRTIVADPPWDYGSTFTKKLPHEVGQKGAECPYPTLGTAEIAAIPVRQMAEQDAHLYLWTTIKFIEEAFAVCRAWGFRPASFLTWTKVHHDDPSRVSMKVGHYFRGATEHVVFGVRGSLDLTVAHGVPTGFLWPRLPHSVKPDAFLDLVEQVSPGPYLELFARRQRLGWDSWGNEALCHVDLDGHSNTPGGDELEPMLEPGVNPLLAGTIQTSGRSHSNPVFPLEIPGFCAPTPGVAEQGESGFAPTAAGTASWSAGDARRTLVRDVRADLAQVVARRFGRTGR